MSHKPDPVDVLHAALLASPLGIAGAARLLGRSPGVMHNKFSEATAACEVTAREALALAKALPTTAYAEAVAGEFGGVFMALPAGLATDEELFDAYLGIVGKMGEFSVELTAARADGVVSPAEFAALELRGRQTIAALLRFLEELRVTVRDVPTKAPQAPAPTPGWLGRLVRAGAA